MAIVMSGFYRTRYEVGKMVDRNGYESYEGRGNPRVFLSIHATIYGQSAFELKRSDCHSDKRGLLDGRASFFIALNTSKQAGLLRFMKTSLKIGLGNAIIV